MGRDFNLVYHRNIENEEHEHRHVQKVNWKLEREYIMGLKVVNIYPNLISDFN